MNVTDPRGPAWSSAVVVATGLLSRIEPPPHSARGAVTRAGVVSALDYDLSMADKRFEKFQLTYMPRLSVMPVGSEWWEAILEMSEKPLS